VTQFVTLINVHDDATLCHAYQLTYSVLLLHSTSTHTSSFIGSFKITRGFLFGPPCIPLVRGQRNKPVIIYCVSADCRAACWHDREKIVPGVYAYSAAYGTKYLPALLSKLLGNVKPPS